MINNKNYVDDDVGIKTFANKVNDRHRNEGLPSSNHGGTDNRYYK
nr:MAG TPA: hypothetical protein [Crassvirales sp.]